MFCFDYAKTLFALRKLPPQPETPMELNGEETLATIGSNHRILIFVTTLARNVFDIRDFVPTYGEETENRDLSITRFMELATSHFVAETPAEYVLYESKNAFYMYPENAS